MKTSTIVVALLIVSLVSLQAQTGTTTSAGQTSVPSPTAWHVVKRGANHNIWQRTTYETGPNGQIVPHLHSYTELASGLNYKDTNGQWQASKELIESYPGGAVALQGQYQVIFANDLNSYGAIDMQTPDGKRLTSNILGLMYVDTASGQAVMIGTLQDSTGELISANQVLYTNAFKGVKADVRYTYRKGGFEQDVILREQPPSPELYGLNPDTTVLEVVTEFINPPKATITERNSGVSGEVDDTVRWGVTTIGQGKAFDLGTRSSLFRSHVSVNKRYVNINGRQFLIERVRLKNIQSQLTSLPLQSSIRKDLPMMASKDPVFPQTPPVRKDVTPMKLAETTPPDQGYVLDYVTISSGQTNFTFQGDTTYYVSGEYNLSGTTTIEGGTVIKLNGSGQLDIDQNGSLDCQTGPYRPAVFTSVNDNMVGDTISGSSGTPATNDVNICLDYLATNGIVHDLRFEYCACGIQHDWGYTQGTMDVWNCQFAKVDVAVYGYNVGLHNVLIGRLDCSDPAVYVEGPNFVAESVTADAGYGFVESDYSGATLAMTNCLITSQPLIVPGYTATVITNDTAWLQSPASPVYQVVGGGNYYLTNDSPYRSAGTTNIGPELLGELRQKTTWPPLVYSNVAITTNLTLSPQAPRDTNVTAVDLGYHYNPMDYVLGGCDLYTNLTVAAGTAIGWYEDNGGVYASGQPYGFSLNNGADLSASGTATDPCWICGAASVQESDNGNWSKYGWMGGIMFNNPNAEINASFTKFSCKPTSSNLYRDNSDGGHCAFSDCEFYAGNTAEYDMSYLNFTNCLFYRSGNYYWDPDSTPAIVYQNCVFYDGILVLVRKSYNAPAFWTIKDSAFDGTAFSGNDYLNGDSSYTAFDYNAYNAANTNWQNYPYPYNTPTGTLEVTGSHDVTITNGYNWQTSWFGEFYLPSDSPLIDAGSTNADQLGLYHFTTQTNQVKETNSIVDIGYHYVATDSSGNPLDSNGNGTPDYQQDANGNGLVDDGELAWMPPPTITVQPTNETVLQGSNATFSVTATSLVPVSYQWRLDGTNLPDGATNVAMTLTNVQPGDAGNYSVVVTNPAGSVTSSNASLTVSDGPIITTQPPNQAVAYGGVVTFNVAVIATTACDGPFTNQWQHDGTNIAVNDGIITTVAGGGSNNSDNGGLATNAVLAGPQGVAVDASGNLYIADSGNNVIRKVATNGIITTVAGYLDVYSSSGYWGDGGLAVNAGLNYPQGVAVDAAGNLYIADTDNNVIRKVATNGIITTVAGGGSNNSDNGGLATNAVLAYPQGVAVDDLGNLYIADTYNNLIRKVDTNGIIKTVAGTNYYGGTYTGDGDLAVNAGLSMPEGVAVDASGNLYIADTYNDVIRKVDTNGIITTVAGTNGNWNYTGDGGQATNAGFVYPQGVAVDDLGNLYIDDSLNYVIRKVDASGIITTVAGNHSGGTYPGDGGLATNAQLDYPLGVSVSDSGQNLYVADNGANTIRRVNFTATSTSTTLTLFNATTNDEGNYQVVISGPCGSVTSSVAMLTVQPKIVTQPVSQTVFQGNNATFSVAAIGTGPLSYQWQLNGADISGATNSSLAVTDVQSAKAGNYSVVVSNSGGSATSSIASLTMDISQPFSGLTFNVIITQPRNGSSLP